ncbi:hypothetical protein CN692_07585 [Bacillus sp. AFS002410]|uniref:hypothetical protein n=1 Tax=Bacillus sp. AFS002410 TaxID=2033481 RepID=UPI000BEFF887|nr:hypothetical protein [Bacillus sp. AFS002410]PEJ58829.1 hypothetical protein CN692_07585 [Bacillus sp. AFS002410]
MNVICTRETNEAETYLKKHINLENNIIHIVPTMILYRQRELFYKKLGKNIKDCNSNIQLHEFNEFIKKNVYKDYQNVLTKSEMQILIVRLMKESIKLNNDAWLSVIPDLVDIFIEWSILGIEINELKKFNTNQKFTMALELYEKYLNEVEKKQKNDFGTLVYKIFSKEEFQNVDEVIIDGAFLPFLPKHHQLLNRFNHLNKKITIFLPMEKDSNQIVFNAMKKTFKNYVDFKEWISVDEVRSNQFFIQSLKSNLLSDKAELSKLDGSLTINRFNTTEEEMDWIVKQISFLLKVQHAKKEEIVIISPKALELRASFRERFEIHGLISNLPKKSVSKLKEGRAIVNLYSIFVDKLHESETYLDISRFEEILNGEILKNSLESKKAFETIRAFYLDCYSLNDWKLKTNELITSKKNVSNIKHDKYHPLKELDENELEIFENFINLIEEIYRDLYSIKDQSINSHLNVLVKYIELKADIHISDIILQRLKNILENITNQENILISSEEFGSILRSVLIDQEEPDEEILPEYKNGEFIKRSVLVTTPNTVNYANYKYVFLCQFTQDMYPSGQSRNWLKTLDYERYVFNKYTNLKFKNNKELERYYLDVYLYYFYSAINACSEKLIISYALQEDGKELKHSHYLHDISKVFGIEEENKLEMKFGKTLEEKLLEYNVLKNPVDNSKDNSEREESNIEYKNLSKNEYILEDLAIYQYCPRRFYYKNLEFSNGAYKDEYQLMLYISSCLYEETIKLLVEKNKLEENQSIGYLRSKYNDKIRSNISAYINESVNSIHDVFPINGRSWENIKLRVRRNVEELFNKILFKNEYLNGINHPESILIAFSLKNIENKVSINGISVKILKELQLKFNNGYTQSYNLSNLKHFLLFTAKVDSDELIEEMDEIRSWYFKQQTKIKSNTVTAEIEQTINNIISKQFNKKAGAYCIYCPYEYICKERGSS